ncbi:MAG: hypothetical protein ACNS60_09630 [Candidatus Cyclobacteriaceae bacterium M2_1C_046]
MIFSYKEINHNIYFFHEHIAYIFRQMFLYDLPEYDENILVHPDFKPIIHAAKKTILEPIKELVSIYHTLPYGDKVQLQIAFSYNNSIESLSNKNVELIKFEALNPLISEKLQTFCVDLWDKYPQVLQMETDFGTVKDHYDKLVEESNCEALVCPFCGIDTFEPSGGKYREAYDHLIAKSSYPFASVNFNLLFPACYKCNSNEKRSTDTLVNDDGTRRAVYHPYDSKITPDDLEINIVPKESYDKLKLETLLRSVKWEFELKRSGNADERLESWDSIYGIRRKYFERINRLEKEWFYELQSKFKDSIELGQSYADFQAKFMKSAKYQILISGMGIIKYSYFTFLFSIANFREKLHESIY